MPFDLECVVVKIYSHFYLLTVRVTKLKQFYDSVNVEYKKVLGYSKTRFLGLLPAADAILRIFDGLKQYFLEDESGPTILKTFSRIRWRKFGCFFFETKYVCLIWTYGSHLQ